MTLHDHFNSVADVTRLNIARAREDMGYYAQYMLKIMDSAIFRIFFDEAETLSGGIGDLTDAVHRSRTGRVFWSCGDIDIWSPPGPVKNLRISSPRGRRRK